MSSSLSPNEIPDQDTDTTLERVRECEQRANQELGDWYDEAETDFKFFEGSQWEGPDQDKLKDEDRIPVTFNRVAATINAICGQEVANRQEVRYLPRRIGPVSAAEPMNDAAKWAREQCNAEDEDSRAFRDMVVCGMGWTVLRMDYETSPDGRPEVIRRSPLSMRWDPSARRQNLSDKAWVQADYMMRKEAIQSRWPDAEIDTIINLESSQRNSNNPIDTSETWKYQASSAHGGNKRSKEYRVTHHVERKSVVKHRVIDPASGQMKEFSGEEWDNAQANHAQLPDEVKAANPLPEAVPIQSCVYWEAWVVGGIVLKEGQAPGQKGFPYEAMTCYPEEETGYWFGVARLMRDPQRYANLMMSQMMSILGTGAKGGLLFETGAFANQKKALEDWARWNSAIELNPGSLSAGKVQPKPPVQLPPGSADLMQFAIGSIRDVTGVNIELLGQQNSNETGVVEDMKAKAGLTILASVFDSMRLYRKKQGVILAEYISRFISDGRLIRVLGPQGEQFIQLLRDPEGMDYDIVVDESPTSRDVKDRTWGALQIIMPMAMQAGMPLPPSLLDYSPLPQSLVMEWKQTIAQKQSQPPQPPVPVQVAQMKIQAEQQAGQMKMQMDQQVAQAKAQATQMAEQARAQADVVIAQHAAHVKAQLEMMKNEQRSQLDTQKAVQEQHTQIITAIINAISKVETARVTAAMDPGDEFVKPDAYPQ